jgi:murein DD-endopeptidase MepM/ murein hydrolase activator NlpD
MGNWRRTARSALVRALVAGLGSALLAVSAPGVPPAEVARVHQLASGARPDQLAPGAGPDELAHKARLDPVASGAGPDQLAPNSRPDPLASGARPDQLAPGARLATAAPDPGPTPAPRPEGTGGYVEPAARFGWPLAPAPTVSRAFQPPSEPYGPGHRGVDLIGTEGQPVLAAGDGEVVYAGPLADRGVVSIDHPNGLRTSYEPVRASVRAGQLVRRGEPVGTLAPGHLGCRAEACLHWGLRHDGRYLDPLLLVRRAHVRLLPWPSGAESGS